MAVDRKALRTALWERLQQYVDGVEYWKRRNLAPGEIEVFPAILMYGTGETPTNDPSGLPPIWDIDLSIVALVRVTQEDEAPDDKLDEIVQSIEAALALQDGEEQAVEGEDDPNTTLGGLAISCWISGPIERGRGEASGSGFVEVPVTIRAFQ